jgi:hypothetical protein
MTIISSQAIAQYRSQLAPYPVALLSLDTIEDCEGDLADAALSLGIQVGQQPDRQDWLEGLAKRCRAVLCAEEFETELKAGNVTGVVGRLLAAPPCDPLLVTPVVLYVLTLGVQKFCEPMHFKIR